MGRKSRGSRFLASGESVVASLGVSAMAILLVTAAASWLWNARSHRNAVMQSRMQQLTLASNLAARSLESMLASDELSQARCLVSNLCQQAELSSCRVVLPDGGVVADSTPALINVHELPEKWPLGVPSFPAVPARDTGSTLAVVATPLNIPGKGSAALEMEALASVPLWAKWELQTVAGAIAVGGMLLLLAVYRRVRVRLRAMGAVRDALGCVQGGERSTAVLQISEALGCEAAAWNSLLLELDELRSSGTNGSSSPATLAGLQSGMPSGGHEAGLADAIDAMWHGVLLIDDRGRVLYGNGAAAIFLGQTRDRLAGSDITVLVPQHEAIDAFASITKRASRTRAVVEVDQARITSSGGHAVEGASEGILRFSFRRVRKSDSGLVLSLIEDVTQQRLSDRSRNSFVAQATHELRTPLTNIRLYVESLQEDTLDPVKRAQHLNVVNNEVRRLERIVGDMLSVSELEAGSLKLATDDVRLEALFGPLQADYSMQAMEKRLQLTFKLPPKLPVIRADRDKIVIAIGNLIGNALKYTPAPGEVIVSVREEKGLVVIDVTDTGIGIDPKEAELVFEKFYRSTDDRTTEITGSGLGLAMARQIARLHDGDITLQSTLNKGSTFTLTLPAATSVSLAA